MRRDHGGHDVQARQLGAGPPAALAGDQPQRAAGAGPDEHGLQDAALLDRLRQREQRFLIEFCRGGAGRADQLDR